MIKIQKASIVLLIVILTLTFLPVNAYDLPQTFSSETIGDPVEVTVPDAPPEQDGILVFLNLSEIKMQVKPKEQDGTVYLAACEILPMLGFNIYQSPEKMRIDNLASTSKNTDVTAEFEIGSNKVTVNGTEAVLSGNIIATEDGVLVPADILVFTANAKVWFDKYSDTLVITTGKYKNDGILRIINYKFWMDGEPFYELSFNKFDLCYQISSFYAKNGSWPKEEHQIIAAEDALSKLHELGFKTIRVFMTSNMRSAYIRSELQKTNFFKMMDTVFDLCDKYEIKVVVCMALPSTDFCPKGEDYFDLICDPESQSRAHLYEFIERFVTRYKDRKSVLMWEIVNEGNLDCDVGMDVKGERFSLYQLGNFYADCSAKIKEFDSEHLITGGDSVFRNAQWHLYLGVKAGRTHSDWTTDTLAERLKAYTMLYHGIDVISIHTYSTGLGDRTYNDDNGNPVPETFDLYMKEAKRMGKVLYNGETAVNADSYDEEVYQLSLQYIQSMIDAGVQLSHWWTFHTDRQGFNDGYGWMITDGELLDAIIAGNKQLKEKYQTNALNVAENNVWASSPDSVVIGDSTEATPGAVKNLETSKKGCGSVVSSVSVISVLAAAFLALKRKNREK